ncbi:hypothetical protein ACNQVK_24880 [Mycobacterium sp. 134]|uniref:hypothetical protein n=1 Tax=Mycobacterium sp. 134 TaxID=3400425 RepID=UPI003AACAF27
MSDDPKAHAGYEAISAYIADRKKTEFESRKRVEDRGSAIVTTSSGLLTLIFILTVVITGKGNDAEKFTNASASVALVASLGAFVIAAALGIFVQNSAWRYSAATNETLRHLVRQNPVWNGDYRTAARICADLDIESIESLRQGTQIKAVIATIALTIQGLAVTLIVIALAIELVARGWF